MVNCFDEMLKSTMDIIAIDTVQDTPCKESPFGKGVASCIEKVLNIAKENGFVVHNEEGYYGTAIIGEGEEFGILGHLDTVPYEKKDWTHSPLGEIDNGIIYGRGILDDKGPMMACLYAVIQLLREGYTPKKKIKFIFGGNEESGWKCIERYNQLEKMPDTGISPDADFPVINCEKGISEIKVRYPLPKKLLYLNGGTRSNIVMDHCQAIYDDVLSFSNDSNLTIKIENGKTYISSIGKPAHGSLPSLGDNALWHILKYLAQFDSDINKLTALICHIDGSGVDLKLSDNVSGPLSFNTGVVKTIENQLEFTFDIRFPISYTKEFIRDKVSEAFKSSAHISHFHDPLYVDKNDNLVVSLCAAYARVTNENLEPITIGGGTYARALKHGVAFGPIFPNQESTIHQANERESIKDFKKMYDIYYEAIKNICF